MMILESMKKYAVIILLGILGWGLCGAIIGIGRNLTTMETTLIIHLIGAPVIFSLISIWYFKKFNYTTPIYTAIFFLSIVIILDAGLVAPVFEGSYDMFRSPMGTWIPFVLIFLSVWITGYVLESNEGAKSHIN